MNRKEVILTIKKVGGEFGHVMSIINGEEFAAGYRQAISDMMKVFGKAPLDPDFESEREAMLAHIRFLKSENEQLKTENDRHTKTIEGLMKYVDIHDILGISNGCEKRKHQVSPRNRSVKP
jgi:hypothetical protein